MPLTYWSFLSRKRRWDVRFCALRLCSRLVLVPAREEIPSVRGIFSLQPRRLAWFEIERGCWSPGACLAPWKLQDALQQSSYRSGNLDPTETTYLL